MNQCAAQQHKAADKELNALYQQITARLKADPDSKKLMVGAQRAWIAFRDAECKFSASGVEGGSVYPLIYSNCITDLTKARVETFKNYLKCQEGDLGCPVPGQYDSRVFLRASSRASQLPQSSSVITICEH